MASAASALRPTLASTVRMMPTSVSCPTHASMRAPVLTPMAPIGVAVRRDGRDTTVNWVSTEMQCFHVDRNLVKN